MSNIKADILRNSREDTLLFNGYPRQPGRIIEYLHNICDGSEVRGESGIYTWPTVVDFQFITTTYTDVTGSMMTYVPPIGTKTVIYKFNFALGYETEHAITDFKLFIDNNEVLYARHNRSARHPNNTYPFEWIFNIGNMQNNNVGRQSVWDTPKIIKMQTRCYAVGNLARLHLSRIWDGVDTLHFRIPSLTLIAIA